jgi:protein subunit release factor B
MNEELKNALDMNGDMLAAMKSREVARKLESDRLLAKMHELQEQRERDSKLKEEALEKLKDLEHRVDNIKTDINEPPKKKKKSIKVKNESKKAPPIPGVWKR